jgi:phospholipase D1/2
MQWQYDTICRGDNSLCHRLLNHTNDPSQYIQFLSLRTHGKRTPDSDPQTEMIYVHSKLMIVDDEVVLCGSANINDRSLLGDRDSEVAVVSRGDDFVESKMNGSMVIVSQSAQELRMKLWKEHFGMAEDELLDPLAA